MKFPQLHREKLKDKKKKKKDKKNKKKDSDDSDEEDEAKKKEKLKKVCPAFIIFINVCSPFLFVLIFTEIDYHLAIHTAHSSDTTTHTSQRHNK